jgi:tripartite-type tricarboxylate transporter receptor subunit TctC
MAPKETPDYIIALLNNAINKALAIPGVVDQLEKADSQSLRGSTPASTGEFWRKELELWLPTIDKMNISLD